MPYTRKIVYLTEEQRNTLVTQGSITVDGVTVVYNENDIYLTPYIPGVSVATEEETRVIITEYGNNSTLIAEMEFYTDHAYDAGFKSVLSADEIAESVTSGKRVLLHIPNVSDEPSYYPVNDEAYLEVIAYIPEYTFDTGSGTTITSPANFVVAYAGNNINNNYDSNTGLLNLNGTKIDDGKLCLMISV